MKRGINIFNVVFFTLLLTTSLFAQDKDKKDRPSPPAEVTGTVAGSTITINYSQPSVKGRKIWGGLVPYNEVWRTGANEATTFETSKDIKIEGVLLPAGKYGLFTIPGETEWTIIFNKTWDQWGSYNYDKKADKLRVKVKPVKSSTLTEKLTFTIEGDNVKMKWEYMEVGFKISK